MLPAWLVAVPSPLTDCGRVGSRETLQSADAGSFCPHAGGASIYDRILRCKPAVVEPRDGALFPEAAAMYKAKLAEGGAVFFAVCRRVL